MQRESPPGLSTRDAKILKSVQRRAHYLDKGFSICGLRFGWTFVIGASNVGLCTSGETYQVCLLGIIPGAGDIADASLNYILVVRKAKQAEYVHLPISPATPLGQMLMLTLPPHRIPGWLLRQMLLNNAVSAAVGFVPFIGDVVLAMYKANSRNAALLEEFLRIRGEEFLKTERERVQDPQTVKPGAGREPGEHVPGKQERSGTGLGWFRRGSKGSKKEKNGKAPAAVGPAAGSPSADRGRFVEDVPPAGDHPKPL